MLCSERRTSDSTICRHCSSATCCSSSISRRCWSVTAIPLTLLFHASTRSRIRRSSVRWRLAQARSNSAIHVQNVDSNPQRFRAWLLGFRRVASRYLLNYLRLHRVLDGRGSILQNNEWASQSNSSTKNVDHAKKKAVLPRPWYSRMERGLLQR